MKTKKFFGFVLILGAVMIVYACSQYAGREAVKPKAKKQQSSQASLFTVNAFAAMKAKRGYCTRGKGPCALAIFDAANSGNDLDDISLNIISSTKMEIAHTSQFICDYQDESGYLEFSSNLTLSNSLANALGYSNVTILSGNYSKNFSSNPFGSAIVDVQTN
jgi:hypothetical protein